MAAPHLEYDPFLTTSQAVASILEESGPLKAKQIAKVMLQKGLGRVSVNAINKALTEYLKGQAEPCEGGFWRLVRTDS